VKPKEYGAMAVRLTETAISKALADAKQRGRFDLADAGCPGLRLRVAPSGSATWILACRDRDGRMRRFTIGAYAKQDGGVGIAEARVKARGLREQVRVGSDPIADARRKRAEARDAAANIGTLSALLAAYGNQRGSSLKSWPDCKRRVEHVFAKHLKRQLGALTARDLQQTADAHGSKQAAAAAVRYIRPILRWASKRGWVARDVVLIEPPATVAARERVLTDAELVAIWRATEARGASATFGSIIKLLMLTGQRREEVAGLAWAELSPDRETWTIPAVRTKKHRAHIVPLSAAARALLPPVEPDAAERKTDPVFPGQRGTPFNGWSKCKAQLDKASGVTDWRLHDLRRTVATGLQRLGVRLEVTEAVLGHVSGSRAGVVGIYQRHDWLEERRAALDAWAAHVAGLLDGKPASNVVQLRATDPVAA
jgi:integrase